MSTRTPGYEYQKVSLGTAAMIAGVGILIMALTVPVVEFYIFPKLIDYNDAGQTTENITNNPRLFSAAIFIHLLTVICDIILAWALYIFLTPVNKNLALLTAWFRLVYTGFNIAAILNLVQVLSLVRTGESFTTVEQGEVSDYVLFYLRSFNLEWRLGLAFFGVYLALLGYLVIRSTYIPAVIGVFLLIAAFGYLIDDVKYFFWPDLNTGFLWFTYFGELVFMGWLLIKGSRISRSPD
jgi:hypothetical protein